MSKRFRIALSFAGEKRPFVAEVARILAAKFGEEGVLYDKYHEMKVSLRERRKIAKGLASYFLSKPPTPPCAASPTAPSSPPTTKKTPTSSSLCEAFPYSLRCGLSD